MASTVSEFDALQLLFMEESRISFIASTQSPKSTLYTGILSAIQTIDGILLLNVYENMENRPSYVVRKKGRHPEKNQLKKV